MKAFKAKSDSSIQSWGSDVRTAHEHEDTPMNDAAREAVRSTAAKLLRSDDLEPGEKDEAVAFLRANPGIGYPHAVRCDWCHEYRTLFRDESNAPFTLTAHGWNCEPCAMPARSQEIRI